jgi:pyrroline-5-carboxylate reductase
MTSPHDNATATAGNVVFVGGGNMARAIVGGLRKADPSRRIAVVEPVAEARESLARDFAVQAFDVGTADATQALRAADLVVWAVKPQSFAAASAPCRGVLDAAVQLSIMAGVRVATIAAATAGVRIVRAMPNTPATIGQGITGLYAAPAVDGVGRRAVEAALTPTGQWLWFDDEAALDAVTALSGSGPAYAFYVLEAMVSAGERLGLGTADAKRLALATLSGAAAYAAQSTESLATLRERVTSRGGTTHAALTVMAQRGVAQSIEEAIVAARDRARELGAAG